MPGLNPQTWVAGGAVPDGVYKVVDARWTKWDYNGSIPNEVFALKFDLVAKSGQPYTQYWSCGALDQYIPNEADGGRSMQYVGSRTDLPANSNAYELMLSLANAGYPPEKWEEAGDNCNLGVFIDNEFELVQRAQKVREGLAPRATPEGQPQRQATTLICKQIIHLPWDTATQSQVGGVSAAASPSPAPAPTPRPAPVATPVANGAATPSQEAVDFATQIVMDVLGEKEGRAVRTDFNKKMFSPPYSKDIPPALKAQVSQLLTGQWPAEAGLCVFQGGEAVAPYLAG